jgi:H+/Cl- antiporter ClcA
MRSNFLQIKLILKRIFDRINNEKLKTNLLQALPFWIASVITGLIAVLYTKLFELAQKANLYILGIHEWLLIIITPICFLISWWIVKKFAPFARGSGIPQVMAAIQFSNPKDNHKVSIMLSLKTIFFKITSSLILVFGGGAIGREGPTIQIAGSIFRQVNQWLPSWWPKISKKNMIITGAAAGLAAAFNTPLGGIVFAVEELSKTHINYFKTAVFTAVIIAGLTAQAILGPYLYLGYPVVNNLSGYIFFYVALVAVVTGLLGSGMAKIILYILKWKSRFKFTYQHILFVVGSAAIVVTIALGFDASILGSGKNLMESILFGNEKHASWTLPVMRIVGPIISFTTGAAGGIFAPSLSAGASVGSLFAGWFGLSATDTNLLVLAGMVGFLTGVTRTPFTSAILVLEMTDRHSVIFHLMLAGMLASLVSLIIDRHSLYEYLKVSYMKEIENLQPEAKSTFS